MINFISKPRYDFEDLVALVRVLRAPDGCPWDSVQTHESIRRNFIEEVYEACEAIDSHNPDLLREELGDVLLHVVFHAGIETDAGRFTIDDVCDTVVKKMVSRHPHLFGGGDDLDWDELKRREKGQTTPYDEINSVARSLPGLWRAEKMQHKAAKAGIPVETQPLAQRLAESAAALPEAPDKAIGEILFAAVNAARAYGIDPEAALSVRCEDFLSEVRRAESLQKYNYPEGK